MGTILASSMRKKIRHVKPTTGPSPCKSCPKLDACYDADLTCAALIAWQAVNRSGTRVLYLQKA